MSKATKPAIGVSALLTIEQVARHTGFCSRQIRRWIASGELQAFRFGRNWRIAENDLALFIARNKGG